MYDVYSSCDRYNHEIAWLAFNWRVMEMALNPSTPAFERLRFLAITGRNLDEFFAKRIGGLKRQSAAGMENLKKARTPLVWSPDQNLKYVASGVRDMVAWQSKAYNTVVKPSLEENGIQVVLYEELSSDEKLVVRNWFCEKLEPILTPLAVDPGHPFPYLASLSLSLAVALRDPSDDESSERFAVVVMPTNMPRFLPLRQCRPKGMSASAMADIVNRKDNVFLPIEQASIDGL